ncbi:MAG: PAS domain S-box protein [Opitutaceae bacterium]|nr:PAS domain S-box protein [Opitutaceae bacterium]
MNTQISNPPGLLARGAETDSGFLRAAFDSLTAEIAILDEGGTIVAVNAARDRFTRENPAAAGGPGANYLELCDRTTGELAADAQAVARGIRAVMAGYEAEFHHEYRCNSATTKRWFIMHVTTFVHAGQRRFVVAHVDITPRKRVEARLRLSDAAIKAVSQGVIIAGPDRVILTANAAFTAITGYGEAEIVGRDCRFLQGPLTDPRTVEAIRRAQAELVDFSGEILNYRKDGAAFWNDLTISPVCDEAGELTHFIGVTRDITARKQAEAECERLNRRIIDVSRQAGMAEVATSVLHNVGNVLNSVNVATTLLGDRVRNGKAGNLAKVAALLQEQAADLPGFFARDERARHLPAFLGKLAQHFASEQQAMAGEIEALRKNVDHIKEIVAMQQSYAKVSGTKERVRPADLVADALNMNAGSFDRHAVEVTTDIAEVPPIDVEKHKVLQILINFLRNAKYACDDSGRPDKCITVRVRRTDESVIFSVTDNGVGIPPENLARIFGHGFTTKKDGHGFGLHSGANAAKEMGGRVAVHSDGPGQGATFSLELPMPQGDVAPMPLTTTPPSVMSRPPVSPGTVSTARALHVRAREFGVGVG